MFGIAKSHLALPLQIILCVINALGVLFGVLYNFNTPDLYEGNIHHTLGWIATGIMSIHVLISLLLGNVESKRKIGSVGIESEPFLRSSVADIGQQGMPSYSNRLEGSDAAPSDTDSRRSSQEWEKPPSGGRVDNFSATCLSRRPKFQWTQSLVNYFPLRFPSQLPALLSRTLAIFHEIITRTILVFGFVCLLTGGVTYAGIFVSPPF